MPAQRQKSKRDAISSSSRPIKFFDLEVSTYLAPPARSMEECLADLVKRARQSRPASQKSRLAQFIRGLVAEMEARGLRLDSTGEADEGMPAVTLRRDRSDRRASTRRTSVRRNADRRSSHRRVAERRSAPRAVDDRRQNDRRAAPRRMAEKRTAERRSGNRRA